MPGGFRSRQYGLSDHNAARHRWYYFLKMQMDAVLLLKQFDSDTAFPRRMTFHTAFVDPTARPDAPERQSIECRAFSSMTWFNEGDVKPSEEVVDSDAGKSWTAALTVPAQATAMLTGVGFGTSSAEAREATAPELMGKLEATGLHDPEAAAAKRRCVEESLECPAFAKTGQISGNRAHEDWRRLVAGWPPENPGCLVQLLRPSWSTSRPLSQCLSLLLRQSLSGLRPRLQCTQHQHPLWKFSCGKTCALSPASDVELGKVMYSVPFRDTWFAAGVRTFYFTVCGRRVLSAEHQIGVFLVSSCSTETPVQWRSSRARGAAALPGFVLFSFSDRCLSREFANLESSFLCLCASIAVSEICSCTPLMSSQSGRAAFGNVKTTLRASLAQHAFPVLSAVSFLLTCSELRCTPVPAAFRSVLVPRGITRAMVQPCQWRGSGGRRVHSAPPSQFGWNGFTPFLYSLLVRTCQFERLAQSTAKVRLG